MELDFKQKIKIGYGPRQTNKEWYEQQVRSLLGIGIYYSDENDVIQLINVDIVTKMSNSALSVVKCLRFLRSQSFFKLIDKRNYVIWADCGSHFRNNELAHYFFKELFENEKITVNLNFFGEKHGKSARDQHFSIISN